MGLKRVRIVVLTALFACSLIAARAAARYRSNLLVPPPAWSLVPYSIGDWNGWDVKFSSPVEQDLSDSMLLRAYVGKDHKHVLVFVGYYSDVAAIMEFHTPEVCYPAHGWSIQSEGESGDATYRGRTIRAQRMLVRKEDESRLVMWWYNAGGHGFEDRLRYVYLSLAMASLQGRTDGSLVRLEAPLEGDSEVTAQGRLEKFRSDFLPLLERALPH